MSEAKAAIPFATSSPDPEVPDRAQRHRFSAEDKERILDETDRAVGRGSVGAILRREGIYSSTLYAWRKERDSAVRQAFSQKRGPQPKRHPLASENEKLRRHNQRAQKACTNQAHTIYDAASYGKAIQAFKDWKAVWNPIVPRAVRV